MNFEAAAIAAIGIAFCVWTLLFPQQYRRYMAVLCSVQEEQLPPFPREAAIALIVFFIAIVLLPALFR